MPNPKPKPVVHTVTGKTYPSISAAGRETGLAINSIQYWLAKSLSGKQADWQYLDRDSF